MSPPRTPRSDSPAEDHPAGFAVLRSWGFSRAGLLASRRGAWWLFGQLRLHPAQGE
ncbi:MAG: hypothetical protein ACK52U_11490 [Synechococcaceae cyanobacterium]